MREIKFRAWYATPHLSTTRGYMYPVIIALRKSDKKRSSYAE